MGKVGEKGGEGRVEGERRKEKGRAKTEEKGADRSLKGKERQNEMEMMMLNSPPGVEDTVSLYQTMCTGCPIILA